MDILDCAFDQFVYTACRLETFEEYRIHDTNEFAEFEKHTKGEKIEGFANQGWLDDIFRWTNSGKKVERIRVIPEKMTDYFLYESHWCYPRNVSAGEQILMIEQKQYNYAKEEFKISARDVWIFDENLMIELDYTQDYEYMDCVQLNDEKVKGNLLQLYTFLRDKAILYSEWIKGYM